jgi:23S rRNA (pseudouridine1915-N3)-methyltransferase|tara:strand:- start:622 stop:1056 length:435 start_codon:yes stop_codon:yes gene_type:complete
MGRIIVHLFGKPKDKTYSSIIDDYANRLSNQGISIKIHSDKKNPKHYEQALSNLVGNLIILDEKGEQNTSKQMAALVSQIFLDSLTTNFAVGPPDGFSQLFKLKIKKSLSLSIMTLPHEMAALILIEQLYRAIEINRGTPYHRD